MERNRIREDLNSADWEVRSSAARALGTVLPDPDALSDLTVLLRDDDTAYNKKAQNL